VFRVCGGCGLGGCLGNYTFRLSVIIRIIGRSGGMHHCGSRYLYYGVIFYKKSRINQRHIRDKRHLKKTMTKKQRILISIVAFLLVSLFFFIIYSEHGLMDLTLLKNEKNSLVQKNEQIARENLSLSVEIGRLENDPKYIENVARQELGMIGKDELILKPKKIPGQ
jgi:cell division protein FtsB